MYPQLQALQTLLHSATTQREKDRSAYLIRLSPPPGAFRYMTGEQCASQCHSASLTRLPLHGVLAMLQLAVPGRVVNRCVEADGKWLRIRVSDSVAAGHGAELVTR